MSVVFAAQYAGKCACCEEWFHAGTDVLYDAEGKLVVVDCPNAIPGEHLTEEQRRKVRAAMCDKCFCVHAGECV
jgi:hypothetical protein